MEVNYSTGPRYINGVNIDIDSNSAIPVTIKEQQIDDPVTGLAGTGYLPGQENRDGTEL
tara:strand:+ start:1189 stop:1365 length:177 start_codon:yes stop_codon:yes gene_type:complete